MAARIVEALERVEVEHEQRERAAFGPGDRLAELALERAVVAQAGQRVVLRPDRDGAVDLGVLEGEGGLAAEELDQLELVLVEIGLGPAHPAEVQRADDLARDADGDDDHRLRLERRAGDLDRPRIEMGIVRRPSQ